MTSAMNGRPDSNIDAFLRRLDPVLHEGVYVFTVVPSDTDLSGVTPLATFREAEGLTVVLPETDAIQTDLPIHFRAAWITLSVHSDLQAVGLTAAFSRALSDVGISCNVIAAAHHDHIFVPVEKGREALERLQGLQQGERHHGER